MVELKILSGPSAGTERKLTGTRQSSPEDFVFFLQLGVEGVVWTLTYDNATLEERTEWAFADTLARALRAFLRGRLVVVGGIEVTSAGTCLRCAMTAVQTVEHLIAHSGKAHAVTRDDQTGLTVSIVEIVPEIQHVQ